MKYNKQVCKFEISFCVYVTCFPANFQTAFLQQQGAPTHLTQADNMGQRVIQSFILSSCLKAKVKYLRAVNVIYVFLV